MPQKPAVPYGHVTVPADVLATALYGLGQYEAAAIEHRGDGLRPSTKVCDAVAWLWENGHQREVTNVIGTVCAILRGRPVPGGVGRITHTAVIDAFGVELAELGMTPEGGWAPVAEHLAREVPRGF
ncbi:hypothetical protein [Streptomyces sp. HUAS TT20]|uniref:hypothetical protein n=1 Tax=Streptomyces sp. HUAS TT20 TaxID=3447509 RepID=UPI0021DAD9EB|nr:hypothetical protein [Streptomyces sp. HUAS 15-9]UXY28564.1 hypothetical protein N8I87_19700 [Streptomyces sp. HUAS 15-9]